MQAVYSSYTQTIKHLINLLRNFPYRDFLQLRTYQKYKQTSGCGKIIQASNLYHNSYSTQLAKFLELAGNESRDGSFVEGNSGVGGLSSVGIEGLLPVQTPKLYTV